jgi:hypothetical protein
MLTLHCNTSSCKLTPSNQPLFVVTNATPATTYQTVLTAKNSRPDACALTIQLEPIAQKQTLPLDKIFIAAISAQGEKYLGNVSAQTAQSGLSVADLLTSPQVFGYLKPKETKDFIWYATVDPALSNAYQGSRNSFDISFHTTCDDPAKILPSPTPSPTPTTITKSSPLPATVLGVSTEAPDCTSAQTNSLSVIWFTNSRGHITWSGENAPTLAFQDQETQAVFRHPSLSKNPYLIPQLDQAHTYHFWLEKNEHCPDQRISSISILAQQKNVNGEPKKDTDSKVKNIQTNRVLGEEIENYNVLTNHTTPLSYVKANFIWTLPLLVIVAVLFLFYVGRKMRIE